MPHRELHRDLSGVQLLRLSPVCTLVPVCGCVRLCLKHVSDKSAAAGVLCLIAYTLCGNYCSGGEGSCVNLMYIRSLYLLSHCRHSANRYLPRYLKKYHEVKFFRILLSRQTNTCMSDIRQCGLHRASKCPGMRIIHIRIKRKSPVIIVVIVETLISH